MTSPTDPDPFDDRPVEAAALKTDAVHGARHVIVGQVLQIAIQMGGLVVLARLLTPADYGLIAMMVAVVGVADILRDFGLTQAYIQSPRATPGLRSNLFWINTGTGTAAGVLVAASAWPLSLVYGDPRIVEVTLVASSIFLVNGVSTQYRADLNRSMRLRAMSVSDVVAAAVAVAVAIVAALLGAGYWALVIQQVTLAVVGLVLVVALGRWRPRRYDRSVPVRQQVSRGMDVFWSQVLVYASRNVDSVAIGIHLGARQLGFYDRAFQLLQVPVSRLNAPATRVALPVLARLQDDPVTFQRFLLRGQTLLAYPVLTAFALLSGFAAWLVPVALGDGWGPAIVVFQILSIGGMFQIATYACFWAFAATGNTRMNLRLLAVTRPLTVVLILAGLPWGIEGVAAGGSLGFALNWPISLWYLRRVEQVSARRLLLNGVRPLVLALVTFLATATVLAAAGTSPAGLGLGVVTFAAVVALACVVPAYRRDLSTVLASLLQLARRLR